MLRGVLRAVCTVAVFAAAPAAAFTIDENFFLCDPGGFHCPSGPGAGEALDVATTLTEAPRWSATAVSGIGLHDGIQVSVEPGFGEEVAPGQGAQVEAALAGAFAAWETPELMFDITFGSTSSLEIDVFAEPGTNPIFSGGFTAFALFYADFSFARGLTNGTISPGWAITHAEIFLNVDRWRAWERLGICIQDADPSCTPAEELLVQASLQNLLMHEIGHAVGLEHPHQFVFANFDDDGDPLTPISVDPNDPLNGIVVSADFDPNAVMARSGVPPGPG